jgi:hypothetical protein
MKKVWTIFVAIGLAFCMTMTLTGCPPSGDDDDDGYCCSPYCANMEGQVNIPTMGTNLDQLFEASDNVVYNADKTVADLHFNCANHGQIQQEEVVLTLEREREGWPWAIQDVVAIGPGICDPLCVP